MLLYLLGGGIKAADFRRVGPHPGAVCICFLSPVRTEDSQNFETREAVLTREMKSRCAKRGFTLNLQDDDWH